MFCLRILLLLHSSLQARGRPSVFMIVYLFPFLMTTSVANFNKCVQSGNYFEVHRSNVKLLKLPETGSLENADGKTCGFKITGNLKYCSASKLTIEYVAVEVESGGSQFCSYSTDETICVCPFFGCNSVPGVFYETIMTSYWSSGKVKGYATESVFDDKRDANIECLVSYVEKINANQQNFVRPTPDSLRNGKATALTTFKSEAPWLFPSQQEVERLKTLGIVTTAAPSTTSTQRPETTSTTTEAYTVAAVQEKSGGSNINRDKKNSNNGLKKVSLVLNVFLSLTAIAMITFIVGVLVYRKKQTNKRTAAKTPTQEPSKFDFAARGGASASRSVSSSAAAGPSFQGPSVSSNK